MADDQIPPPLPPLETSVVQTKKLGLFDFKGRFAAEMENQRQVNPERFAKDAAIKREREEKAAAKEAALQAEVDAPVRCPGKGWPRKCGSTQLQISEQKFGIGKAVVGGVLLGGIGLLAGGIGRGNVIITCLKCGHRWTPGK